MIKIARRWITKGKGKDAKHIPIKNRAKKRVITVPYENLANPEDLKISKKSSVSDLETTARDMLKEAANTSTVDQMLLYLKKYSGLLGEYSSYNSFLIEHQDPKYSVVRSKKDWQYFGRQLKENAKKISILYPITNTRRKSKGEMLNFIEKMRVKGHTDEEIAQMIQKKYPMSYANVHTFGIGTVYDQKDTIPGNKAKFVNITPDEELTSSSVLELAKEVATQNYNVTQIPYAKGRGYTKAEGEMQTINVMDIPDENKNALHTLLHELSHAGLMHVFEANGKRAVQEGEAELSAYLIGQHFGINFEDSAAYIKSHLNDAKLREENINRAVNTASRVIMQLKLQRAKGGYGIEHAGRHKSIDPGIMIKGKPVKLEMGMYPKYSAGEGKVMFTALFYDPTKEKQKGYRTDADDLAFYQIDARNYSEAQKKAMQELKKRFSNTIEKKGGK